MQAAVSHKLIKQQLKIRQKVQLKVISNSMAPLIRAGDLVEITAVLPSNLQTGSIITVVTMDGLLTHRLVNIEGHAHQLFIRGEWQMSVESFAFADYLGQVTAVIRGKKQRRLNAYSWQWMAKGQFWLGIKYLFVAQLMKKSLQKGRKLFLRKTT
ncbi:MAG: S24/S26 family peptidase [Chloroflexota bacterium]